MISESDMDGFADRIKLLLSNKCIKDKYKVTQEIQNSVQNRDFFQFLIEMIKRFPNDVVGKYCVLLLKNNLSNINRCEVLEREDVFTTIYDVLFTMISSNDVQRMIIDDILHIFMSDKQFEVFLTYINNTNDSNIYIILKLLKNFTTFIKDIVKIREQCFTILQRGLEFYDINVRCEALHFGLTMCSNPFEDDNIEVINKTGSELMSFALELYYQLHDTVQLKHLTNIIYDILESYEPEFIDPYDVINLVVDMLKRRIDHEVKSSIGSLLCPLFDKFKNIIDINAIFLNVYNSIVTSIEPFFDSGECMELSPYLSFIPFRYLFSENTRDLPDIIKELMNNSDSHLLRFSLVSFIYCTVENTDLYLSIIDQLMIIFSQTITDQSLSTREISYLCISLLSEEHPEAFENYADSIYTVLINSINQKQSIEMIRCLTSLFQSIKSTDNVFESVINIVFSCIQEGISNDLMLLLGAAIDGSEVSCVTYYPQIMKFIQAMIYHESMKCQSIYCLALLSGKDIPEYEENLEFIAKMLGSFLSDGEDVSTRSLESLGLLVQHYPEQMQYISIDLIKQIVDIAICPNSSDYLIAMSVNDMALRVACLLCSTYTLLLPDYLDSLIIGIENKRNHYSARAAATLTSCFQNIDISENIISASNRLSHILSDMIENGDKKSVLHSCQALSYIMPYINVSQQEIIVTLCFRVLDCEIPLFNGEKGFDPVHNEVKFVLSSALSTECDKIYSIFMNNVKILHDMLMSTKKESVSIALTLFGEMIYHFHISQNLISQIFEVALREAAELDNYAAVYFINKLSQKKNSIIVENSGLVLDLLVSKLGAIHDDLDEDTKILLDNCISALATLVLNNIINDNIRELVDLSLDHIPVMIDIDEYVNVINYFDFLLTNFADTNTQLFFKVLTKIFSDSEENLISLGMSHEILDKFSKFFRRFSSQLSHSDDIIKSVVEGDESSFNNVMRILTSESL